ncbi:CpaF family protein [Acidaminobacter hydrogenoformans]|uniref:Pilus assembly protein CpaF n=1 Tax=Acidaminobacter hydrogenoformans DSM 2784 TaxID=1120920 RepID=A0A1G5RTR5_9FIRM|nr:CpaF family protein [Acidaminobacter hydrogenoformans]SCZ77100.1 pilus assembly protein CpaF [Acidaminobacter hydrogenoformans DSM 2784]
MAVLENEEALFERLCSDLADRLSDEAGVETGVRQNIEAWIKGNKALSTLSTIEKISLSKIWLRRIEGYDFLEPYLKDPEVTEIMVNGPDKIFVETRNVINQAEYRVSGERLRQLIQKMVSEVDRRVNFRDPIVDARLKDGARLNVVMPPIALDGPYLTIRKFRKDLLSLEALRDSGMMDDQLFGFLKGAVFCRQNLIISGGTSSGKTTLLNCLSRCIPAVERVISIEDSAELNLSEIENLVRLETRPPNTGDGLEITMSDLIRTALRMRPDRMIVGEIRGSEALDMLQALNTGHDGSMSTGHSNSAADMLDRIEAMAMMAGRSSSEGIRRQIGSGVHWVIHLKKDADGSRKIQEVIRIKGFVQGAVVFETIVSEGFVIENMQAFDQVRLHG